jgi:hypothetical protein
VACGAGVNGHVLVVMGDASLRETDVHVWGRATPRAGAQSRSGGGKIRMTFENVLGVCGRREEGVEDEELGAERVVAAACGDRHALVLARPRCGGGGGGEDEGGGGGGGGEAGQRVYVWGGVERGELGLELGFGALQRFLGRRVTPATLGTVVHTHTACCVCRCDSIKGVRYLLLGAERGLDLCAKCLEQGQGAASFIGNQYVALVCARKLPQVLSLFVLLVQQHKY